MKKDTLYKVLRPLIKLYMKVVYHPKYKGLDNIPKEGSIVLAGNHTNNLDCLLLISSTNRVVHFLAKDSLMKGIKKILFKNMGIIPVNRKIHDKKALSSAIKVLESNEVIGIFPEGTINRTKDIILPFKIGAVKMSSETDSLLVPFIIKGKYKIFNNNLEIEFLKGYKIKKEKDLTSSNKLLEEIISKKIGEKYEN